MDLLKPVRGKRELYLLYMRSIIQKQILFLTLFKSILNSTQE